MGTGLRYTGESIYQTFPFQKDLSQETEQELAKIGEQYHEHRKQLMLLMQLGLTKTYNFFHASFLTSVDIEKYGKQDRATAEKAFDDIMKLRELHKQMDEAVLDAYGWNDIKLQHDFYEVDYSISTSWMLFSSKNRSR